jgi:hypothetical protein
MSISAAVILANSVAAGTLMAFMVEWYQGAPISRLGLALTGFEVVFLLPLTSWLSNALCWYLYGRALGGHGTLRELFEGVSGTHALATLGTTITHFGLWVFPSKLSSASQFEAVFASAWTVLIAATIIWYTWSIYANVYSLHGLSHFKAATVWILGVLTWPFTFVVGFIVVGAAITIVAHLMGISFFPPGFV